MTQITAVAFVVTRKDDDDDFRGNRKAPKKLWSLPQVFQVKLIGSGFVTFFRSRTKSFSSWLWLQASLNKKVPQDLTGGNKIWKSDRNWPTWLFELQGQIRLSFGHNFDPRKRFLFIFHVNENLLHQQSALFGRPALEVIWTGNFSLGTFLKLINAES